MKALAAPQLITFSIFGAFKFFRLEKKKNNLETRRSRSFATYLFID